MTIHSPDHVTGVIIHSSQFSPVTSKPYTTLTILNVVPCRIVVIFFDDRPLLPVSLTIHSPDHLTGVITHSSQFSPVSSLPYTTVTPVLPVSTDVTIIEIEIEIVFLTEHRIESKSYFSCIPSNDLSIEA